MQLFFRNQQDFVLQFLKENKIVQKGYLKLLKVPITLI